MTMFGSPWFGAAEAATFSLSFNAQYEDTSDASTYTFSSSNLGTVASGRRVGVIAIASGNAGDATSVTINGVSGTVRGAVTSGDSMISIWDALVPSGATGDIVVVWPNSQARCSIGVYAFYNAAFTSSASSSADPGSAALTIPANGGAIGGGSDRSGINSQHFAWVNLTEDWDSPTDSGNLANTGASSTTAGTPTITCTSSGSDNNLMLLAAYELD